MHWTFLSGSVKLPILYTVDRTRDGKVYSSRNIKAMQEGRPIFTMQASFKTGETDPFHHQFTMPTVPSPDECMDLTEFLTKAVGWVLSCLFFINSDNNIKNSKSNTYCCPISK